MEKKIYNATYELLNSIANYLQDPSNEVFQLLEEDNASLNVAAKACVISSQILKKAIFDIQLTSGIEFEPEQPESAEGVDKVAVALSKLQSVADTLDSSEDETQTKTASVLDEVLLILANTVQEKENFKKNYEAKIESIKNAANGKEVKEPAKKEEYKNFKRILQEPLSARHCPNCPGSSLGRIEEGVYGCPNCRQKFNYQEGYTKLNGAQVPGGSVNNQTNMQMVIPSVFYKDKDNK